MGAQADSPPRAPHETPILIGIHAALVFDPTSRSLYYYLRRL